MRRPRSSTAHWWLALGLSWGAAVLSPTAASAQQSSIYNQYMLNPLIVNPGYAGKIGALNLSVNNRFQWAGFEGSPQTHTAAATTPLMDQRMAVGGMVMTDGLGVTRRSSLAALAAYRLQTGANHFLSFGMQLSAINYRIQYSQLQVFDVTDDTVPLDDVNQWRPNIGAGLFWYSPRAYVGLSMPTLVTQFYGGEGSAVTIDNRFTTVLTAGYVFFVHPDVALKPHFLVRHSPETSPNIDINLTGIFRDVFWVGTSYRVDNSLNFITQVQATAQLSIGYGIELPISELRGGFTTHEVGVQYRFAYKKGGVVSPRYF